MKGVAAASACGAERPEPGPETVTPRLGDAERGVIASKTAAVVHQAGTNSHTVSKTSRRASIV